MATAMVQTTQKALFDKAKMIFYTANTFIQDLIHDMLKLSDRPEGAYGNSPKASKKFYEQAGKNPELSPTSAQTRKQMGLFKYDQPPTLESNPKKKQRKQGGGPQDLIEYLKKVSVSDKLGFIYTLIKNAQDGKYFGQSPDAIIDKLESQLNDYKIFLELIDIYQTYNLLIQLNGKCRVKENPIFFTTTAALTAAQQNCESFDTLIIDFEKVRLLMDPTNPIVEYGGGIFFHGEIYENVHVQYFNYELADSENGKPFLYEENTEFQPEPIQSRWPANITGTDGRQFNNSTSQQRWREVNTPIRLLIESDQLGIIIIYPYKAMGSMPFGFPDIRLVWYGTDGNLIGINDYEAHSANFLFRDEINGRQYARTMISCSVQKQLSDWLIFNYGSENIREQLFGYNFYVYTTQYGKLKVIEVNEDPSTGEVLSIEAMMEGPSPNFDTQQILTIPINEIRQPTQSGNDVEWSAILTNSLDEEISLLPNVREEEGNNIMRNDVDGLLEGRSPVTGSYIDSQGNKSVINLDNQMEDDISMGNDSSQFTFNPNVNPNFNFNAANSPNSTFVFGAQGPSSGDNESMDDVNQSLETKSGQDTFGNFSSFGSGFGGGGGGGKKMPKSASVSITWMVLIGVQVFNTPLSQYIREFKESVINDTTGTIKWKNTLAQLQYEHLWPYMTIRGLTTSAEGQNFGWKKKIKATGSINLKASFSAFDSDLMESFKKFMRDPNRRDEGLKGIFGSCDGAKDNPQCTYIAKVEKKGKKIRRMGVTESKSSGGTETTNDSIWQVMKRNNTCFPNANEPGTKAEWEARGNYFTSGNRETDKYLINNAIGISSRGRSTPYLDNMDSNWFCPITSSIDPQATCQMTGNEPLEWNSYKSGMEWGKMDVTVGISGESTDLARNNCSLKYRITLEPNFTSIDSSTGIVLNAQGVEVAPQVSHKKQLKIGKEILLGEVGGIDNSAFTINLGDDVSRETDAKNSLLKLLRTTTSLLSKDIKGYMGLMKKIKIPLIEPRYYYVAAKPIKTANSVGAESVTLSQAYSTPFNGIHAMRRNFPLPTGPDKKIKKSISDGINPSLFFIDNPLQENDRVIKINIDDITVDREKLYAMAAALQDQVTLARSINFGSKSKTKYLDFVCVFSVANGQIGLVPHDSISNSAKKFPKDDIWTSEEGTEAYNIRRTIAAAASTKLTGDQIQEFGGVMANGGYVGNIYKAGENLPIYSGRGSKKKQVGVTPSILPPNQGRVMLGNDQPSSIRAMVMALYAQGDINKKSIVGYMPVDGYFVVASPNGGDWSDTAMTIDQGGGAKRKKRKKKKTKKRKKRKIKTRRRNKKRGTKKNNKKRRITRHKK